MEPTTNDPRQPEERAEPPRKPYHPPQVTLYGDLAELTKQDPNPLGGPSGAP